MVEWIEVDEGGCTHSHVANRRRGATVYIQHNHGSNYLLFVTRTLKTYYVDTFYTLGQAKAAGDVLYEELGQPLLTIPDHWRPMSQNQSASTSKQASSLRTVASTIAQNLEDLASELSGLSKLASYQLTLEEAKAEVAIDLVELVHAIVGNTEDRFLRQAWEYAVREIRSNMGGYAKSKGYVRGRNIHRHMVDVIPPLSWVKVETFADKAREKGKIGHQPVAETFLALYIGKELEKFANTIEGFPFILKLLRSAVSTTMAGQGFKTTADPDTIAKIEAMAQAVAKNLAAKASKAAIILTKASL
jgi:hypothetical protein